MRCKKPQHTRVHLHRTFRHVFSPTDFLSSWKNEKGVEMYIVCV